jgi:hypothetical protein
MKLITTERWNRFLRTSGLSWQAQVIAFLLAAVLIFSRRPDVLLNAQFYAEDGVVWYAQAYNLGWLHALLIPAGGYLTAIQGLVGGLSLLVPFRDAPWLMNFAGLILQALPAWFLLTRRCVGWGSLPVRVLQALIYLAIPNSREVHVVLTNSQFHLALLAFLVAFATPPPNRRWKIFDVCVLLLNGFSGPFGIVLLPLMMIYWWRKRQKWSLVVAAVIVPTVVIQLGELFYGGYAYRAAGGSLGATPLRFARILAGQVYFAAFLGENDFATQGDIFRTVALAIGGSLALLYCLRKCNLELKLFILFSFALFAASLIQPRVGSVASQWEVLTNIRSMRYWFFPMLALLWSLLWYATNKNEPLQMFGFLALLTATIGMHNDWRYLPYKDENFQQYVSQFEAVPAGTVVSIPVFPDGFTMQLKKKAP